ncbi:hypothetical protein SPI_08622 [Niveomyces insectorum RCEF 264]|uniref:Uncharacterized protein n=1 Tax=Niveomyces insectorum RCEF 264 TaxID=1081102 RepID=A0A167MTW2_9HYPO|nr:hypothetical protein SPI_08622 [Niveomyces insectorum RCEF 264]
MESLQLAQMLADLSDLDAAVRRREKKEKKKIEMNPGAAHALVHANADTHTTTAAGVAAATEPVTTTPRQSATPTSIHASHHRRVSSSSALAGHTSASPAPGFGHGSGLPAAARSSTGTHTPFDSYLGRRLLTPPITRSSSSHGSLPGTPRGADADFDVERASSLMALYELRAKLKQYNDGNSLRQAREKVAALSARQPHQHQHQQPQHKLTSHDTASSPRPVGSSTSSPQPPPLARRHSQYTYPRT